MRYFDTHLVIHSVDTTSDFLKPHYDALPANTKPDFLFFVRNNPEQIGHLQLFIITRDGREEMCDIYASKRISDVEQVISKLQMRLGFKAPLQTSEFINTHQAVHRSFQKPDSPVSGLLTSSFGSFRSLRDSFGSSSEKTSVESAETKTPTLVL